MIALIAIVLLVGWKVTTLQKEVLIKKDAIRKFHKKISKIEQKNIEDMEISWKDQKEGISTLSIFLNFLNIGQFLNYFFQNFKSKMIQNFNIKISKNYKKNHISQNSP